MNENDFTKNLNEFAEKFKKDKPIYITRCGIEKYDITIEFFISVLLKIQKLKGIYVSLNKECGVIENRLKNMGINTSQLYFIDGVSKTAENPIKATNSIFLSSFNSLTEISLAITNAINTGEFDFLFLDSLSTLLVYNDPKTVEMFCHYLLNKLRSYKLGAIILCLKEEKETKKLIPIISQFCDAYIEVEAFF